MKRTLLIAFALIAGLFANAQTTDNLQKVVVNKNQKNLSTNEGVPTSWKSAPAATNTAKKAASPRRMKSGAVGVDTLGNQSNAFGWIDGSRQLIWADPRINSVAVVHRTAILVNTSDAYTGFLRYDWSADGGNTFTNNIGPMYIPNAEPSYPDSIEPFPVARYPQGGIYNPPGNTSPSEAYVVYYAASLDNTNPDLNENPLPSPEQFWGGHVHGTINVGNSAQQTQVHDSTYTDNSGNEFDKLIPEGFTMDSAGHVWNIDAATNEMGIDGWANGNGVYTGNMIISKGTFNTVTHGMDYIHTLLPAPLYAIPGPPDTPMFAACNIAFDNSGNTGYVIILGNNTYPADSSYYPIIYKTTDGGNTWTGPTYIVLDNIGGLMPNVSQNGKYFTGYGGVDAIVDINKNLHINVAVFDDYSPGGAITPGFWGYFDIYTIDGGTTWMAHLLSNPETFEGTFSPSTSYTVNEYSRGQASSTILGDHLFFSWFDTDTSLYGSGEGNANPDMHAMGYNVATQTWTPDSNFTSASNTPGQITFGTCSQWVFTPSTGVYNIPAAFQSIPNGTDAQSQLYYLTNVDFSDADFTVSTDTNAGGNTVPLTSVLGGIKVVSGNEFSLNTYPNPASNFVCVNYQMDKEANVTIEILNILGERVLTGSNTQMIGAGVHNSLLNISTLSSGVYMVRTTIGDKVVISKLTKI